LNEKLLDSVCSTTLIQLILSFRTGVFELWTTGPTGVSEQDQKF